MKRAILETLAEWLAKMSCCVCLCVNYCTNKIALFERRVVREMHEPKIEAKLI